MKVILQVLKQNTDGITSITFFINICMVTHTLYQLLKNHTRERKVIPKIKYIFKDGQIECTLNVFPCMRFGQ